MGAVTGAGRDREALLRDAIFTRMVGQHGDSPAGHGRSNRLVQRIREDIELRVDLDPNRLERPLCGMPARSTSGGGNRRCHDLGEFGRRPDRAGRHDRIGDATGKALIAVNLDHACELVAVVAIDDVVRRPLLVVVHPHVDRALVAIREPALGAVELRRRHAEVEQGATDLGHAMLGQRLVQFVEPATARADTVGELGQSGKRCSDRIGVLVDAENVDVSASAQQCMAVTAAAERRVDDGPGRNCVEDGRDLVNHHGIVFETRHWVIS